MSEPRHPDMRQPAQVVQGRAKSGLPSALACVGAGTAAGCAANKVRRAPSVADIISL